MAECSLPSLPSVRSLQAPEIQLIQHTSTLFSIFQFSSIQKKNPYMLGTKQLAQQHICLRSEPPPGGGEEYVARAC